jgi:hypothetical protein
MPSSSGAGGSSGGGGGGGGSLVDALSFMGGAGKSGSAASGRRVGVHFTVGLNILPFFFCVSLDQRFLLSCGHWDNCTFFAHNRAAITASCPPRVQHSIAHRFMLLFVSCFCSLCLFFFLQPSA